MEQATDDVLPTLDLEEIIQGSFDGPRVATGDGNVLTRNGQVTLVLHGTFRLSGVRGAQLAIHWTATCRELPPAPDPPVDLQQRWDVELDRWQRDDKTLVQGELDGCALTHKGQAVSVAFVDYVASVMATDLMSQDGKEAHICAAIEPYLPMSWLPSPYDPAQPVLPFPAVLSYSATPRYVSNVINPEGLACQLSVAEIQALSRGWGMVIQRAESTESNEVLLRVDIAEDYEELLSTLPAELSDTLPTAEAIEDAMDKTPPA